VSLEKLIYENDLDHPMELFFITRIPFKIFLKAFGGERKTSFCYIGDENGDPKKFPPKSSRDKRINRLTRQVSPFN
jgi:hypothetical protein